MLALASGLIGNFLGLWIYFALPGLSSSFIAWFSLAFAPVSFVLGVALPFAAMYLLTSRHSGISINVAMISAFLGCWIGEASTLTLDVLINCLLGGSYGPFLLIFRILWGLFAAAFSPTLFIILTAILLADYRKTTMQTSTTSEAEAAAATPPL